MAESEDKDKGFTVQDRRRFSSEGEAKSDQPQEKTTAPANAAEARAPGAPPAGIGEPHAEHSEISFATFVVGLSTQALSALGEIPDPGTGERLKDLRAAEQLIDIIGMLREKTRGNLDREEDGLIEAILFDLRMKYVELSRQSSR